MTTTRQQLEDVIRRQLTAQIGATTPAKFASAVHASTRTILAAVDDWAAGQVAAAVTPPAVIQLRPMTRWRKLLHRRALRQLRKQFLAALAEGGLPSVLPEPDDDTTTGNPA